MSKENILSRSKHMYSLKTFVFTLIIAGLVTFIFPDNLSAQKEIHFDKVGEIKGSQNHFLGSPKDIVVADDRVFIADKMDLKVKVYSAEGEFIREMGGRGRGPGELQRITAMWKGINNKTIHIADYFNSKVVSYSKDGTLIDEKNLGKGRIVWPRIFHPLSETSFLILFQSKVNKNNLFHIWENNLQHHKYSFALPPDVIGNDQYMENHLGFYVGSSLVNNSTLYYVPPFYKGNIYYRDISREADWNKIKGVSLSGDTYEPLNSNDNLKNAEGEQIYDYRLLSKGKKFIYRLFNTTKSLFSAKEGLLAHFVEIRKDGQKHQGIELYDTSGNFLGFHSYFHKELSENRYTMIPEHPKAIDSNNRVYTINRKRETPVISIYHLKIDSSKLNSEK